MFVAKFSLGLEEGSDFVFDLIVGNAERIVAAMISAVGAIREELSDGSKLVIVKFFLLRFYCGKNSLALAVVIAFSMGNISTTGAKRIKDLSPLARRELAIQTSGAKFNGGLFSGLCLNPICLSVGRSDPLGLEQLKAVLFPVFRPLAVSAG